MKQFTKFRSDFLRGHFLSKIDENWMKEAMAAEKNAESDLWTHPLPPSLGQGEAFLKVYRRRAKHGLLRRLRPGRAAREGSGYRAFAGRNIETPQLLFDLEERRKGLFEKGYIATVRIDAPTVAEAYVQEKDDHWLEATVKSLLNIHQAGLAHGDPRTRNFLATHPVPMPFDLPSWNPLSRVSQAVDLERLLGSVLLLTEDIQQVEYLLKLYADQSPIPLVKQERLLERAVAYRERKSRP